MSKRQRRVQVIPPAPRPAGAAATAAPPASEDLRALPAQELLRRLRGLGDVVAEIGAALWLPAHALAQGEALERLEVTTDVPLAAIAEWRAERIAHWWSLLGDDLSITLALTGQDDDAQPVEAHLDAGGDARREVAAFVAAAGDVVSIQGESVRVQARVTVRKVRALAMARALAGRRADAHTPAEVDVFYCAGAFNRLLGLESVPYLESAGVFRPEGRTGIVLCDATGYLAGVALEIIGAGMVDEPEWLPASPADVRRFAEHAAEVHCLWDDDRGWPTSPRVLTPETLRLRTVRVGLEATALRLARLRAELAACALATVVQGDFADGLTLRLAGTRPAICHLSTSDGAISEPDTATGALARLADWAYQHASPDTVIIARECLARELPPGGEVTLAQLERAAGPALDAALANFALYVRGTTDRYFAARQSAQDAVAAYAETVRSAVADLTADVVDNVYRTVGLLVGVVVAWLLAPRASPVVVRLAAVLYTLYVAFVIIFVLRARSDRYALERAALATRLSAMTELTEAERTHLASPATAADAHFSRYFRASLVIYGVLLVAGLVTCLVVFTSLTLAS